MLSQIVTISILSGVFFETNCATAPTTEAEVLHYLEAIGLDVASNHVQSGLDWPLVYVINRVDKPWKLEHLGSWIELVGIVCENLVNGQSHPNANIMTGCSLFDGIAAHFLASLHSDVVTGARDLSQAVAYYRQPSQYITFDQAKGFFPSACKKIMPPKGARNGKPQDVKLPYFDNNLKLPSALLGCRLLMDISVEYLVQSQIRGVVNFAVSIPSTNEKYPGMNIQADWVKNMFPWICDRNEVRRVKRELIYMVCDFFTGVTNNILKVTNDAVQLRHALPLSETIQLKLADSPISIPQAKEFIADECKKGKYQLACYFLLKERLDILLFRPEV